MFNILDFGAHPIDKGACTKAIQEALDVMLCGRWRKGYSSCWKLLYGHIIYKERMHALFGERFSALWQRELEGL